MAGFRVFSEGFTHRQHLLIDCRVKRKEDSNVPPNEKNEINTLAGNNDYRSLDRSRDMRIWLWSLLTCSLVIQLK